VRISIVRLSHHTPSSYIATPGKKKIENRAKAEVTEAQKVVLQYMAQKETVQAILEVQKSIVQAMESEYAAAEQMGTIDTKLLQGRAAGAKQVAESTQRHWI
jgi:hypothetical protein